MRIILLLLLATLTCFLALGQEVYVPYRVGDKFGIATPDGAMKTEIRYDYISPCNLSDYFIASFYVNYELKSDLIYRDKIVIANKGYDNYEIKNNLIIATYSDERNGSNSSIQLYSDDGKILLPDFFDNVFIPQKEYTGNDGKYIVIYGADEKNNVNVYLYNSTKREISDAIVQNELALRTGYEVINEKDTVPVIYTRSLFMTYHQHSIQSDKTGRPKLVTEPIEDFNEAMTQVIFPDEDLDDLVSLDPEKQDINTHIYETDAVTTVEMKKWAPTSMLAQLEFWSYWHLEPYRKIIRENGKVGVFFGGEAADIPVIYDSIYFIIAKGRLEYPKYDYYGFSSSEQIRSDIGYITCDKGKYGLILKESNNKRTTISPRFDFIPAQWRFDFGKKGFHLFALCDREGQFVCYADGDGRLYYKK